MRPQRFATQPLPQGPNVVVLTTAGGWGVVTSDAIARADGLTLMPLPDDLMAEIDTKLPARWSRNNPVDCAGGETRDTIPEVMEMIAAHPDVDAMIYLGVGIQSNEARLMREGGFHPGQRPRSHRRRITSVRTSGSPRPPTSSRVATTSRSSRRRSWRSPTRQSRSSGRPRHRPARATPRGNRAVTALEHLYRYAEFRRRRGSG